MAWFRANADIAPDPVPYYTLGGRRCGPFLSALWWGCVYLTGEDDGVVPMDSSHKPRATIVADGWWDHDEIKMGSRTWALIESMVLPYGGSSGGTVSPSVVSSGYVALSNMLLRGGEVEGSAAGQPFPLESGLRKVSFIFYASSPTFSARLIGPDGTAHPVQMRSRVPAGDVLGGAWVGSVTLAKPPAGEWRLETNAKERAGYLMVVTFEGGVEARLQTGGLVASPGSSQQVGVAFAQEPASVQVSGTLDLNGAQVTSFAGRQTTITLPTGEGVYNLTVAVTGTRADGSGFERTLVGSIAVMNTR